MRTKLVLGLFALSSLAFPLLAHAQHAAAAAPPAGHAAPPATAPHPSSSAKPASHSTAAHHSTSATSAAAPHSANSKSRLLNFDDLGSAPLGPHFVGPVSPGGFINPLSATNGQLDQQRRSRNSNGVIFFGGGYGYDYSGQDYQDSDQAQDPQARADDQSGGQSGGQQSGGQQSGGQQQPQYIFVQQVPDPRGRGKQSAADQSPDEAQPASAAEREPAPPLPDVGSFTLVTRQGNMLDAVAFTRSSDRLVYITPDGGRRTLAFRDLDVNETQRLNAERGTPITIPPADDAPPAKPKTKASSEITN
jgi:hypothetical protein